MKSCPFCAEQIQDAAIKCRFCGERLGAAGVVTPLPSENELVTQGYRVGNFRLVAHLGTGGMGSVFVGEHPDIGKRVAIKIMRSDLTANPEALDRFLNEAQTVVRLRHPSIVDVLDYGTLDSGQRYLVMEHLDGEDLQVYRKSRQRLSPHEAAGIVWQILDALAAAHAAGVVHRDLKPENVFVIPWGRRSLVKLLDFGIAKLLGEAESEGRKTQTGVILGTPAYMAPEQAAGRRDLDGRTDLYAVGILLYELVVGRRPFHSPNPGELLLMQQSSPPPPPRLFVPQIPPLLEELILKCLEKDPDRRPQSAGELRDELQGLFPTLPRQPLTPSGGMGLSSGGESQSATLVDAKAWALQASAPGGGSEKGSPESSDPPTEEAAALDISELEGAEFSPSQERKPESSALSKELVTATRETQFPSPEAFSPQESAETSGVHTTLSRGRGEVGQLLLPAEKKRERRLWPAFALLVALGLGVGTVFFFSEGPSSPATGASQISGPSWVLIHLDTTPSGAVIFAPDQEPPLGKTPDDIEVPPQGRRVILRAPGFLEREVMLRPGDPPRLTIPLEPEAQPSSSPSIAPASPTP